MTMSNPEAEAKKELGNKAFAAKDYDEAIKHYTAAIAIDSKNCVYYSNRSACHGGKQQWAAAAADAKECIKNNPTFIKGYYRLASAQTELDEYEAALATVKQGLGVEPENPQLMKQMRSIKARRSSARRGGGGGEGSNDGGGTMMPGGGMMPYRNLDSATSKEVMDLQRQLVATTKEYRMVKANIVRAQNGKRSNELTKEELEKLPTSSSSSEGGGGEREAKIYRSVGKMFMLSSRSEIMNHLDDSIEKETKECKDLNGKLDYLERRMKSQQANIQELTKGASSE